MRFRDKEYGEDKEDAAEGCFDNEADSPGNILDEIAVHRGDTADASKKRELRCKE